MLPFEPLRGCRGREAGDEAEEDAVEAGETVLGEVCCGQLPRGGGALLDGIATRGKLDLSAAGYSEAGSGESCTMDAGAAGAGREGWYVGSCLGACC